MRTFRRRVRDLVRARVDLRRVLAVAPVRSGALLFGNTLVNIGFGFVFWNIAARTFPAPEVGLAAALISLAGLVAIAAKLGLDSIAPKYLDDPRVPLQGLVHHAVFLPLAAAFILSLLVVFTHWTPLPLFPVFPSWPVWVAFIATSCATTVLYVANAMLVAAGRSKEIFTRNFIISVLKLLVLLTILTLSFEGGVFVAWAVAAAAGVIWSVRLLLGLPHVREGHVDSARRVLWEERGALTQNYLSTLLSALPAFGIPVLVASLLGTDRAAYYYIVWTISLIVLSIPQNLMPWILRGSSDGLGYAYHERRAVVASLLIAVPVGLGIFVTAPMILGLFGEAYLREGLGPLLLLLIAVIPTSANSILQTRLRARGHARSLLLSSALYGTVGIGAAFVLLPEFGIMGAAIAWTLANCAFFLLLIAATRSRRIVTKPSDPALPGLTPDPPAP